MGRSAELSFASTSKQSIDTRGILSGFRNKIINGDFDLWQRGPSQTSNGYGSADRWNMIHVGSSKTTSIQNFAIGHSDVPGNPVSFCRTAVTSVAGAGNLTALQQYIEDVRLLQNKTGTLTFYAKADAPKNIAIEFVQHFGTGDSPSPDVTGIGAQLVPLTTSWQKFSIKVDFPSILGKNFGSTTSHYIRLIFWFEAGSNYNSRTANLGQQSGTFDIAHVSLVEGDATAEIDPFEYRSFDTELSLCERFYQVVTINGLTGVTYIPNGDTRANVKFNKKMRISPTGTYSGGALIVIASGDASTAVNVNLGAITLSSSGVDSMRISNVSNPGAASVASSSVVSWGLSSPLTFRFDAEL